MHTAYITDEPASSISRSQAIWTEDEERKEYVFVTCGRGDVPSPGKLEAG